MLVLTAALNVVALVGLVRFSGTRAWRRNRSTRAGCIPTGDAAIGPLSWPAGVRRRDGAGAEALLDYVLKSRASATLVSGPRLMAFFAAYHTGMGLLALAGQLLLAGRRSSGWGLREPWRCARSPSSPPRPWASSTRGF